MKFSTAFGLLVLVTVAAAAQPRRDYLVNDGWKFLRANPAGAEAVAFADAGWKQVSLPHTWNALDGQDGGNDYYRGTGWYRRHLLLGDSLRGKQLYLYFEGAGTTSAVFINGQLAGTHRGNFGAFCFDITPFVSLGADNVLAVRVNNARDTTVAPLRGDFTIFGGLYRNVHLLVLESLSISPLDNASSGVYVRQRSVSAKRADLEITVLVRNASQVPRSAKLQTSLLDASGRVVKMVNSEVALSAGEQTSQTQTVLVDKPRLWNGRKDPYLYEVAVSVMEGEQLRDRVVQAVGLRSFSVDPDSGFFLNGERYLLHGVNRHQDRENKGWAISPADHQQDYAMIEEVGATAVRLAHYQHAQEFYDLCDRGGMVVWAELALVDEIHPDPEFLTNCKEQLTELIKQSYNHPSIMFWSLQNELIPDGKEESYGAFVAELHRLAKALDPTRPTTVASRSKYDASSPINTVSDLLAYNVYRGWYEGKPEDFARFADELHERYPTRGLAISEYGAGGDITHHEHPAKRPPTRGPWHPEEWQAIVHEVTWKAMSERPYLWGTFVWNMFDFASDGRSEGGLKGRNDKGLVTFDRSVRKDAFYWYKANWTKEPMVHLTSKRFSRRVEGPQEIKVYSNCPSVELFLNGSSVGRVTSADRIFRWSHLVLGEGTYQLRSVGESSGAVVEDEASFSVVKIPATGPGAK